MIPPGPETYNAVKWAIEARGLHDLGFMVQGLGFRVQGLVFKDRGFRCVDE